MGTVLFSMTCPVIPVSQPRQRHAVRGGHAINYTPSKHPVQDYKAVLRLMAAEKCKTPLDGPLVLVARFYMPRPKRLMTKKAPEVAVPHTSKPDLDNLIKGTKDALKGILWNDDAQVFSYDHSGKWYHAIGEQPHVDVWVVRKHYGEDW